MPSITPSEAVVHVAAAAIYGEDGRLLVSRRAQDAHQGGLWEFPGGKVEANETVQQALSRELEEELGIQVKTATPLIRIPHRYTDKTVLLDVWKVSSFAGEPEGREGQPLKWLNSDELNAEDFPAANRSIITALQLPDRYLITGEFKDQQDFMARLDQALAQGLKLVQLRAKQLDDKSLQALAAAALLRCREQGAALILNASLKQAAALSAHGVAIDGVHLSTACLEAVAISSNSNQALQQFKARSGCRWVGASCHTSEQLAQAASVGVDYASLSPVQVTATHPDARPLGWQGFGQGTEAAVIPVYALGGMSGEDVATAIAHGGQGVAMIRGLWKSVTS